MPITQIPFQGPVPPPPTPEKPQPEQLGLYDSQDWEQAYRELDARVPHLLIQLQDDLARSRKREAVWISIIVHLVLAIVLVTLTPLEKYLGWHRVVAIPVSPMQDKNVTFLPLPPDLQKPAKKPNTNVLSDKDRIATAKHPELDPKELRKILATPPPGAPGMQGPRGAPAAPPAMSQNPPSPQQAQPQPQQQPQQRPQFETDQTAKLQTPPRPNAFSKYSAPVSVGTAMQQAAQAAAANRGGGQGGDFGLDTGAHGRQQGGLDILSDTQGVDFGPYLQRVLQDVKDNWYHLIPESAEMKKGKLAIEFAIMSDGHVQGLRVSVPSGDPALDRPAYGAITASNPFPPLPSNFKGPYLALRFRFYYNPDKADLQ